MYRNDGGGVFTQIKTGALPELTSNSTGLAWGDYDNDGYLDLFVCRLENTFQNPLPSFLFHNNGDGTFTQVQQSPFTDDTGFATSCSWGDYDNDGWLDLIVSNYATGGNNRLYHNNGDGTFTRVLSGSVATDLGNSAAAIWGDYDRDGFLDLFISNGTAADGESSDFLYHNNGNSNSWITIKCIGTRSNRSAIGTKVRTESVIGGKTVKQLREINTGDGWSQNPLEVHFGLGDATNVALIRIEWPSGTVQELHNVPAKQFLTVQEPPRIQLILSSGLPLLLLQGGRGIAYDLEQSKDLVSWATTGTLMATNFTGTVQFTVPAQPASSALFYRAASR